jgi:hypothetical protein
VKKLGAAAKDHDDPDLIQDPVPKGEAVRARNQRWTIIAGLVVLTLLIILVIVLAVVFTRKEDPVSAQEQEQPVMFDFRTGVSIITYYGVNSTISQR